MLSEELPEPAATAEAAVFGQEDGINLLALIAKRTPEQQQALLAVAL